MVKRSPDDDAHKPEVRVDLDENQEIRWFLKAGNGDELCRSPGTFAKPDNARRSAKRIKAAFLAAEIITVRR